MTGADLDSDTSDTEPAEPYKAVSSNILPAKRSRVQTNFGDAFMGGVPSSDDSEDEDSEEEDDEESELEPGMVPEGTGNQATRFLYNKILWELEPYDSFVG